MPCSLPRPVLILGGTTEGLAVYQALRGSVGDGRDGAPAFKPILSLAGRTRSPRLPDDAHRIGGFGGVDGLARWLRVHAVAAMLDATHPFAARISANAVAAAALAGVPLGSLVRDPWTARDGDRWLHAAGMEEAAGLIGTMPTRVLLSVGRQELAAFSAAAQHRYFARVIDPPDAGVALPPDLTLLYARGPFRLDDEIGLLRDHAIDVVVSKNSGGDATYAKIVAARQLGLPVVMIARPRKPAGHILADIAAARTWLEALDFRGGR